MQAADDDGHDVKSAWICVEVDGMMLTVVLRDAKR